MSENRSSIEDGEIVSPISKKDKQQQSSYTNKLERKHSKNASKSSIHQYESSFDSDISDDIENTSGAAGPNSKNEKYEYTHKKTRKHKHEFSSEIKDLLTSAQHLTRYVGVQDAMRELRSVCSDLKSAMKKLDKIRRIMKYDNKDVRKDPDCVEQAECIFSGIRSVHVVSGIIVCRNYEVYSVKDLMKAAMNYRHLLFSSLQKKELEHWYENCNIMTSRDRTLGENRERHRRNMTQRFMFHDNALYSKRFYHADPHYQRYMRFCYNKPFPYHKSILRSPFKVMMTGTRPKMQISSFEDKNVLRHGVRSDFEPNHIGNMQDGSNQDTQINTFTSNRNGLVLLQQCNNNNNNSGKRQRSKSPDNNQIESISESISKLNMSHTEEVPEENKQKFQNVKSLIADKNTLNEESKSHLLECPENEVKDMGNKDNCQVKGEWNLDNYTDKIEQISVKEKNILSSETTQQKSNDNLINVTNVPLDKITNNNNATNVLTIKAPTPQLNSIITKNEVIEPNANASLKPIIQSNPKLIMSYDNTSMHFLHGNTQINKKAKIEDNNKFNLNTSEFKNNIYLNCPSYINTYSATTKIPNILEQSMIQPPLPPMPPPPPPPPPPTLPQYYCYLNTNYEAIPIESFYTIPDYQMSEEHASSEPMDMRLDDEIIEYKAVSPESMTAFENGNLVLNESLEEACSETSVMTDPDDLDSNFILKESQISPDIEIKMDIKKFEEKIYDIEIPKVFPDSIINTINKEMLKNGYLVLIVDLDVFVSVTEFNQCTSDEMAFLEGLLKNEGKRNIKNRTLYKLEEGSMWIKFRPGFKSFMKYAIQAFKLYFKSSKIKSDVVNIMSVLEIDKETYIHDKLIYDNKNEAFCIPGDLVLKMPFLFLLDHATSFHKNDQMVLKITPYFFFKSTKLLFGLKTKALLDYKIDESDKEGYMMSSLETLLKMRKKLFKCLKCYPYEYIENLPSWDARTVISQTKLHLFKGLNFVFSRIYTPEELPQNHWLWLMAIHHGAHCQLDCSDKVTHVIATTRDTRKVRWGIANDKHVVTPTWLEISCTLMYKLDEKVYSLM